MTDKINIPKTIMIARNKLIVDKSNPNVMDEKKFEALKEVIKKFGFIIPIITNKEYKIADGFHRWKAARDLGIEDVPIIALDVDEVDRRILRQVLNKLKGEHKEELDQEEFKFLDDKGAIVELMNYLPHEGKIIKKLIDEINAKDIKDEEEFIEVNAYERAKKATKIVKGDIFKLGSHRLLCGNSTKEIDVNKLMNGSKADMIFTDPPYGIDYSGGRTQVVRDKPYGIYRFSGGSSRNQKIKAFFS